MDVAPITTPRQAGIYVQRARTAQGLTRAQLAEASGVSVRSLASLESGDAPGIRLDKLLAVYHALNLSLAAQGERIAQRPPDCMGCASTINKPAASNHRQHTVDEPFPTLRPLGTKTAALAGDLSYEDALRAFIADNSSVSTDNARHHDSTRGR